MGIKTVHHPPYSPEPAPCDICLFPKLRDCRYETTEEMKEAVTKVIDTLTREDFDGAFQKFIDTLTHGDLHGALQKMLERYKGIEAGGEYFEGAKVTCVLSIKVPI